MLRNLKEMIKYQSVTKIRLELIKYPNDNATEKLWWVQVFPDVGNSIEISKV